MTIDITDPCVRAAQLSQIYLDRVAAGGTKMVRTKSADNEREVQFHSADISLLRAERDKAIDECRAQQGLPPLRRRFAIQGGSRRSFYGLGGYDWDWKQ